MAKIWYFIHSRQNTCIIPPEYAYFLHTLIYNIMYNTMVIVKARIFFYLNTMIIVETFALKHIFVLYLQ